MNGIVLIFYIMVFVLIFVFWIIILGGKYLAAVIKEKLPWIKGKGKWILIGDKSKNFILDYRIPDKYGRIVLSNGDKYTLGQTKHTLEDITRIKDFKNLKSTVHHLDKKPLYIVIQGCPTDVLLEGRDYEEDIEKIKEIISNIDSTILTNDENIILDYQKKLKSTLMKLLTSFKYLKSAKLEVKYLLSIESDYRDELDNIVHLTPKKILEEYRSGFIRLSTILTNKTGTLVNFEDYYRTHNISKLFNDSNNLFFRFGVLFGAKKSKIGKLLTIGMVVVIIVMIIVGIMSYTTSNKVNAVQSQLATITNTLNDIKNSDLNSSKVNIITTQPITEIPTNSPVYVPT
jgi:hypothetical protein